MGLTLPVPSVTVGPAWAAQIVTAFDLVDSHNHTAGQGTLVPLAGLDINADLSLGAFNLTNARTVRLGPVAPVLVATDKACIYTDGVDLVYRDGSGNVIPITAGGAISATSLGGITGLAAPAAVTYNAGAKLFTFSANTGTVIPGSIDIGQVVIREAAALNPKGVTVKSAAALAADYTITLPATTPAAQSFVTMDASGNLATAPVANSSVAIAGATLGFVPTGVVLPFAGATAPAGFLLCNGAAVSRTTYAALFAVVSTTYGAGDGSTTFNVPDTRSRALVGMGQGSGLTNRVLAATGGEETHALSIAELAAHTHGGATGNANATHNHGVTDPSHQHNSTNGNSFLTTGATYQQTGAGASWAASNNHTATATTGITVDNASPTHNHSISSQGSGTAHQNMQPFLVLNHIVKF